MKRILPFSAAGLVRPKKQKKTRMAAGFSFFSPSFFRTLLWLNFIQSHSSFFFFFLEFLINFIQSFSFCFLSFLSIFLHHFRIHPISCKLNSLPLISFLFVQTFFFSPSSFFFFSFLDVFISLKLIPFSLSSVIPFSFSFLSPFFSSLLQSFL
ncbi:unnamed protein product [Acanthosepion pharaonis]|uniref:Uncharacterized protein n=1 Tax=Acanthosepion pharaonis TaxID=158019 RepID=A0A812DCF1_ACAPH|nr:unnamed protein product [Sepia pharaonis]